MSDKIKVRDGKDGYSYPYTSPDLVIDKDGKSNTTKFNEIDSQFKDIATKTIIEDGKLYLVKSDGIKIDKGTTLPNNGTNIPVSYDNNMPNVVLMGDSISDTVQSNRGEWVRRLTDYLTFKSFTNYAVGAARWTFQKNTTYELERAGSICGENVIWNQYNRMISDIENNIIPIPNVVIIFAGTNDAIWSYNDVGVMTDAWDENTILNKDIRTLNTLVQSVRYLCESILKRYPKIQIILSTPIQNGAVDHTEKVRDAIKESADKLSAELIDAYSRSGLYMFFDSKGDYIYSTNDSVHPNNSIGNVKLVEYMQREMKNKINLRGNVESKYSSKITSINASYSTSHTAHEGDDINSLIPYINVTANYEDGTTLNIPYFKVTGTISKGENSISVMYSNKTTEIIVNGTDKSLEETSITATYTQGDTVVKATTPLENLRANLAVTINYDDGSSSTTTDYTLNGNLIEGQISTITVTHNKLTTTFTVKVSEATYTKETALFYNPVISENTVFTDCNPFSNGQILTMPKYFDKQAKVVQFQFKSPQTGTAKIYITSGFNNAIGKCDKVTINKIIEIPVNNVGVHTYDCDISIPTGSAISLLANGVIGYTGNAKQQETAESNRISFSDSQRLNDLQEGETFAAGSVIPGYMALSATVKYVE